MNWAPPKQRPHRRNMEKVLFLSSLVGNVAASPFHCWWTATHMRETPNTTKRTMIRASLHGYDEPPHSSAISRHVMLPAIARPPSRSNWTSFCVQVFPVGSCFCSGVRLGGWKQKTRMAQRTAPMGRLIQKHHLQPILLAICPPMMGPMMTPTPSSEPRTAV